MDEANLAINNKTLLITIKQKHTKYAFSVWIIKIPSSVDVHTCPQEEKALRDERIFRMS